MTTLETTRGSLPDVPVKVGSRVKFPKNNIGPQFVNKVLHWFETFWHNNSRYPRDEEVLSQFDWTLEQVQLLRQHPFWLKCLERRGIKIDPVAELSPLQIAAISLISNFNDNRSLRAKMAQISVTEEQLNGWYADPKFNSELQFRTEQGLERAHSNVQASLLKQIDKGSFQATKFYYEITGRASTPEVLKMKETVQALLEAVQKHVTDPATLQAIAQEVQTRRELGGF